MDKVRIDKWLWAARFFKTRSLAAAAVTGGKVHVNGQRVKAAKAVTVGDELRIHRAGFEYIVTIIALNDRRRPAKEAVLLYEESPESLARREEERDRRRLERMIHDGARPPRRPSKRDRRKIRGFIGK